MKVIDLRRKITALDGTFKIIEQKTFETKKEIECKKWILANENKEIDQMTVNKVIIKGNEIFIYVNIR